MLRYQHLRNDLRGLANELPGGHTMGVPSIEVNASSGAQPTAAHSVAGLVLTSGTAVGSEVYLAMRGSVQDRVRRGWTQGKRALGLHDLPETGLLWLGWIPQLPTQVPQQHRLTADPTSTQGTVRR